MEDEFEDEEYEDEGFQEPEWFSNGLGLFLDYQIEYD